MTKIAIVASEGGMACAYSVGVILALVDKYHLTDPDFVIGSSGSTGTLAYFSARQYRGIRNIWENLLSTDKFVSFSRPFKIMDIDYLIDEVFKRQEPLNIEAIKQSKIQLFIAATNLTKGETRYFSNQDDIFEALRASNAIPFFFGRKVIIDNNEFVDGAVSTSLAANIKKAKELGAQQIIAIDSANESFWSEIFLLLYKWIHSNLDRIGQATFEASKNVCVIKPSKKLPIVSAIDNNQGHLKAAIKIGYDDVMENKELEEFLKNSI